MTTQNLTPILAITPAADAVQQPLGERLFQIAFGAIQWPWLLLSLYGGTQASKDELRQRVSLAPDALPYLGGWKADTFLLNRLVDLIEEGKPQTIVELGCGATTLVLAKALQMHSAVGKLISYDQNADFVVAVEGWLCSQGVTADLRHAPLTERQSDWPGLWYKLEDIPASIDLLVIDGPPWAVHPFVRGAAEILFSRLAPGGVVVLDDAARPGERVVARRWKRRWGDIQFELERGGSKGMLIGRKSLEGSRRSELEEASGRFVGQQARDTANSARSW
jgi:predicted O-methyltransferase YrrM